MGRYDPQYNRVRVRLSDHKKAAEAGSGLKQRTEQSENYGGEEIDK